MMLFRLSIKNLKKSFKDYAIYFFTLILGVAIFYIFNAIDSQTVMLNVSKNTHDLIDLMNQVLSGVSVFVSGVLGFLIIYASRFLIKRRKKEFGIYMTLGMSKRKISLILLYETLSIGIISLGVGLLLGVVFSQAMSVLVINMFEADMSQFAFTFSNGAMIKTIIYFSIMYFLVMIFNTFSVSKCKLIDLIQASKKNETVKMKNPIVCVLVFIIAACILGYAYYNVTAGVQNIAEFSDLLIQIGLGCFGTLLIFWSFSGLVLRIVSTSKKIYLKGLNAFTLRQLNSQINTTVVSMSIICIMLFMTICILASATSIKTSMAENLKEMTPVDIEITKPVNASKTYYLDVTKEQDENSMVSVRKNLEDLDFNIDDNFKDVLEFSSYVDDNITWRTTFGDTIDKVLAKYSYLNVDQKEILIEISDYNRLAELFNIEKYSLSNGQYMIIGDYDEMIALRNEALKIGTTITINGKTYSPKYKECKKGFIDLAANHITTGIILLPDGALENSLEAVNYLFANYKTANGTKEEKQKVEDKIRELNNHPNAENIILNGSTKIEIYEASIGLAAMATFIGLYLGIIFLISSAAILALKELSESSDNKDRYMILRKIGVDEKMLNKALYRQIAIFFFLPLSLALIHTIFGLQVCNTILETFGRMNLLASISMTAIFLVFIYGGYFLITYFSSKNIIRER